MVNGTKKKLDLLDAGVMDGYLEACVSLSNYVEEIVTDGLAHKMVTGHDVEIKLTITLSDKGVTVIGSTSCLSDEPSTEGEAH